VQDFHLNFFINIVTVRSFLFTAHFLPCADVLLHGRGELSLFFAKQGCFHLVPMDSGNEMGWGRNDGVVRKESTEVFV